MMWDNRFTVVEVRTYFQGSLTSGKGKCRFGISFAVGSAADPIPGRLGSCLLGAGACVSSLGKGGLRESEVDTVYEISGTLTGECLGYAHILHTLKGLDRSHRQSVEFLPLRRFYLDS